MLLSARATRTMQVQVLRKRGHRLYIKMSSYVNNQAYGISTFFRFFASYCALLADPQPHTG
jgi:hypothetical protein